MLLFLQPIWLWLSAGIIVPVLIHLWNVKKGKTLKVGSIALFTASAKSSAKSFRLSDLLLLLIRCLLLSILSFLIAKPVWNKTENTKEKGWILIPKDEVKEAYKSFHPLIDTLLKQGYAFHDFDEHFEEENWQNALQTKKDAIEKSSLSYWALLKILNDKASSDLPVYLFTDHQLQKFGGTRPDVSLQLKWYTFSSPDSTANWLAKAYQTTKDSIRVITARSSSTGTYYTSQNSSVAGQSNTYSVHTNNGKIIVTGNDSLQQSMVADTATVSIAIYTTQYPDDAHYLKAAINAIKDFTQSKIKVFIVNNIDQIPANTDWLFWLSEENIPLSKMRNNVFKYENGKPESIHSALFTGDEQSLTISNNISLTKYIKRHSDSYQALWKNGFDEPVLSKQNDKASVYHFYSHFNPQWNDLVWSHAFPQLMYDLIFTKKNTVDNDALKDKRVIDPSLVQPLFINQARAANKQSYSVQKDISNIIWLIAFFLFVLERILSFRIKNTTYE